MRVKQGRPLFGPWEHPRRKKTRKEKARKKRKSLDFCLLGKDLTVLYETEYEAINRVLNGQKAIGDNPTAGSIPCVPVAPAGH